MVNRFPVAVNVTKSRNNILWLIVGLALGVCLTNLAIGGRHVLLPRAGDEQSPIELERFLRQQQQQQQQQQHQSGKQTPIQREGRRRERRTKTPESTYSSNKNDNSGKLDAEPFLRQQQQQQHQSGKQTPIQRERRRKDRRTKTPESTHSSNRNDDSGKQHVYDGDLTRILKGEKPFPESSNGQQLRLKFRPGTLQLSHAEALQYCFVNTTHYGNHIPDPSVSLVSLSDRHKLIYRNIPKSSSR